MSELDIDQETADKDVPITTAVKSRAWMVYRQWHMETMVSRLLEHIRVELIGSGMAKKKATSKSWEIVIAAIPYESDNPITKEVPLEKIPARTGEKPDVEGDIIWVYDHFCDGSVSVETSPSAGAWSMLRWARGHENDFFNKFVPKVMEKKGAWEDDRKKRAMRGKSKGSAMSRVQKKMQDDEETDSR